MATKKPDSSVIPRPPVVSVLGHVDHGKSTLLDYIRKTNTTDAESGGITQRLSSYEVVHTHTETGDRRNITFLDTPGHEAFTALRKRGARVADVGVLVVSAEDGVMPQTEEALDAIRSAGIPFVVALNKIDKPNADIERSKQSLSTHEIYIEEYGGDVPLVPVSAITGHGIPDLLNMILLLADMEELTGNPDKPAEGIVLESHIDPKRGATATLIIKDGTLKQGTCVVSDDAYSPVRQILTAEGEAVTERRFSSPVNIAGWSKQPSVGADFFVFESKKEAEKSVKEFTDGQVTGKPESTTSDSVDIREIPIILKTETQGSTEAIQHEIEKIQNSHPEVHLSFLSAETGTISERDIQTANINKETLVIGFNTGLDPAATRVSEQLNKEVHLFSIIYELTSWLDEYIEKTRIKRDVEKEHGRLKILKYFSSDKKGHVLGGYTEAGTLSDGDKVRIIRNGEGVGQGKIKQLQQQRVRASSVKEGSECGILLDSPAEPREGDILSAFTIVRE